MAVFRTSKAIDRLEDRIRTLELKQDDLHRTLSGLNLEFIELYDKVSHQMSRMAKRYARQQKENGDELPTDDTPLQSDSLDPVSRSIMLRRGMGVPKE